MSELATLTPDSPTGLGIINHTEPAANRRGHSSEPRRTTTREGSCLQSHPQEWRSRVTHLIDPGVSAAYYGEHRQVSHDITRTSRRTGGSRLPLLYGAESGKNIRHTLPLLYMNSHLYQTT